MIKFVWTNLVHAPHPSKLIYLDSHCLEYLVSYGSNSCDCVKTNSELVIMAISASFDIQLFSAGSHYKGRTIATPFLSTTGLEDPVKDRRLLGNCVYSPIFSRFGLHSFTHLFTGSNDLGYYYLHPTLFSDYKKTYFLPRLSGHAVINYYVVDIATDRRISRFFDKYEQVEIFAKEVFMQSNNKLTTPIIASSIRSCIRKLKHPIGVFSHVRTMAGSISASELLLEFSSLLRHGGGS